MLGRNLNESSDDDYFQQNPEMKEKMGRGNAIYRESQIFFHKEEKQERTKTPTESSISKDSLSRRAEFVEKERTLSKEENEAFFGVEANSDDFAFDEEDFREAPSQPKYSKEKRDSEAKNYQGSSERSSQPQLQQRRETEDKSQILSQKNQAALFSEYMKQKEQRVAESSTRSSSLAQASGAESERPKRSKSKKSGTDEYEPEFRKDPKKDKKKFLTKDTGLRSEESEVLNKRKVQDTQKFEMEPEEPLKLETNPELETKFTYLVGTIFNERREEEDKEVKGGKKKKKKGKK